MSTPVPCMLPLADLLKAIPELWEEVATCLDDQRRLRRNFEPTGARKAKATKLDNKQPIPMPIKKVGKYYKDDEGNTTLPIEIGKVISTAILDSEAAVSIATKSIWEKWGKPTIWRTRMNLQLADGSLENPIGLLE